MGGFVTQQPAKCWLFHLRAYMSLQDNLAAAESEAQAAVAALDAANAKVVAAQAEIDKAAPVVSMLDQVATQAEVLEQEVKDAIHNLVAQIKALL
jgi:hypothetical protein